MVRRMRLVERFHTPEEHQQFLQGLLQAKRLRKEIAKLQMYRRIGIRTMAEAEKFELDKERRQLHKAAAVTQEEPSLWKQYTTTHKNRERKSLTRGEESAAPAVEESKDEPKVEDPFVTMPGYVLLSSKEAELCRTVGLTPSQYMDCKSALLEASVGSSEGTAPTALAMLDIERRGNVIDFVVQAGWISARVGKDAREAKE